MLGSRLVLLAAWSLLAVGAVTQFVGDEDRSELSDVAETLASAGAEQVADRLIMADDDATADGEESSPTDTSAAPDDQASMVVDDPAAWGQATVALPDKVLVATVVDDGAGTMLGTSHGVAATAEPGVGAVEHWFPSPTQFGGPRVFLVIDADSDPDHIKVSLPVMPNGQEGWIPRNRVELSEVTHRALVDLSSRTVTVWADNEVITDTRAVIGQDETPTPIGLFYVRDIVAQTDPDGPFGPQVLVLSGFSEVLETFDGGLPAIAIHGNAEPSELGNGLSAGCVRIPDELIEMLASRIPVGTPVVITA